MSTTLRCRLGMHRFGPWHDHGPCVFSADRHLIRRCLHCPKIQSRFAPFRESTS